MRSSPIMYRVIIGLAVVGLLAVLRSKPWQSAGSRASDAASTADGREHLTVGFLPVT